ncbi:(2Fe-2S)-binding protein [Paenibacillus filicis]|uniref:(2Fe-2S)-binding protein n=1 Tax=Paenibacillus filicis TaxID=669464 RepID=A0ABU9DTG7_9BACL
MINSQFLQDTFYIRQEDPEQLLWSSPAAELLQPGVMNSFLELYGQRIKALEPAAAAVYMGSWLGFLALGQQYVLSAHNRCLDMSLDNLVIQLYEKDSYTLVSFKLGEGPEGSAPEELSAREGWLGATLEALYGCTLRPLLAAIAEASGVEIGQLWGQFPTKFNYYIDYLTSGDSPAELKERIQEDYRYLRQELPAEVFGRKKNPLDVKVRMIESLKEPGKQMRMKNACCLYYRTEGGQYCYSCPRMKEEERAKRREQARAATV